MPDDDLEPLITECPSCLTRFRVSEAQLERARGRVRCGACLTVFHGVEHLALPSGPGAVDQVEARQALDDLLDELASGRAPAAPAASPGSGAAAKALGRSTSRATLFAGFEDAAEADAMAGPPAGLGASERASTPAHAAAPEPSAATPAAPAAPVTVPTAASSAARPSMPAAQEEVAPEPASAESPAPSGGAATAAPAAPVVFGEPRRRRPMIWLGGGLAVLLLTIQVLWYRFDDWAVDPGWRPLYATICGVIGCSMPVQRDASLLAIRNLVVRIHPTRTDALLVNAVIVNGAPFEQPFPALELQFTTVRGNLVASRRFEPDEYLAGDAAGLILIPPRTPVQVELAMDDPGPAAVNYRLNFR